MSELAITAETRQTLTALQRAADVRAEATGRLATGLRVQSATDDPNDFFRANALNNRATDFLNANDDIGQSLSAVETTLVGLDAIADLTDQLRGVAQSALGGNEAQRLAAAEQFTTLRDQINALAQDTSFGGINLIAPSPDDVSVNVNDGNTTIDIEGNASGSDALGIGTAASFNNFATDADIQNALDQLDGARVELRSSSATFGGDIATLTVRENFNQDLASTLEIGAQSLVEADLGEEAARLLAADVRTQLGFEGLQIVQQNASAIAGLL